jgi:hypothetical protein
MIVMDPVHLHDAVHALRHDPETTVTVALDAKEVILLALGLRLTVATFPCLAADTKELGVRVSELMEHQWDLRERLEDAEDWGH